MKDVNRLTHSVWECKYHTLWIPKCRRKKLYGEISKYLGKRQKFRAWGYYVSMVGRDEETIKEYIREPKDEDKRLD
jgi:REP element-mobilizing transposase RayT